MPSPFPGMDPYIEARREWSDFHSDLAGQIRARLNQDLQNTYYATAVVHTAYEVIEITSHSRSVVPDVSIWNTSERSGEINPISAAGGGVAVIDPPLMQSQVPVEVEVRIVNVEVREAESDRLVTAIEILSPVNKRNGLQREKYLQKRQGLFRSIVHVMEIDLLRVGHRSPLEIAPPVAPYYVTLGRSNRRPTVDIWPIQLDEKLPRIPIPLTPPDPDVVLDLGEVVKEVYDRGAFARRLDYSQPVPAPKLTPEQQEWVDDLLASHRQIT